MYFVSATASTAQQAERRLTSELELGNTLWALTAYMLLRDRGSEPSTKAKDE